MEIKPTYYAIIPANVRYDSRLNANSKLLYAELTVLTHKDGCCYASNDYLADLYDVSVSTIKRMLKQLEEYGYTYTKLYYKEGTKLVERREIFLSSFKPKEQEPLQDKVEKKIKIKRKPKSKRPTLEEVKKYCKSRNSSVDANTFYNYYEAGNWLDAGGNPVLNWKLKLVSWENRNKRNKPIEQDIHYMSNEESKEEYEREKAYWEKYLRESKLLQC